MLEISLITFREGLEAFLVVAIMTAYLANTNRKDLVKVVYLGTAISILISVTTGWHIAELAQDPVMEGALAIGAGVLVASLTFMVMYGAKNIKQEITSKLDKQISKSGWAATIGILLFTILMITREGMETAMMIGALSSTVETSEIIIAALIGFIGVGLIGYLWISQSARINLGLFMQVTGIFLMLFCIHLLTYGFHELTEAGVVPMIDNFYWHTLTEPLEPNEPIGQAITIGLLAIPCLWLFVGYAIGRVKSHEVES